MKNEYDIFCIGTGIMSTTLASILKHIDGSLHIGMVDRVGDRPQESSAPHNNSGTGHSGFCELNYDTEKAIKVCEAFEQSKGFWSLLVQKGFLNPEFIHQVPHVSFVEGRENVDLLKKRWLEMKNIPLFKDMEFTEDQVVLKQWMPLVMHSRNRSIPMAATRIVRGSDVDFGLVTEGMQKYLNQKGVDFFFYKEVIDIKKNGEKWDVTFKDRIRGAISTITTRFLFIGAGGATLPLLQKTGIPEVRGYGGFPVSGQFLVCRNPKVVNRHNAKVYGKPETGSPPMSMPHLDTRIINGEKVLLFGPFAGFSTKFLKQGHWTDFFKSLRLNNIFVILMAGLRNLGLSKYLFKEVIKNHDGRFKELLKYYPNANIKDWKPIIAGQRVQVIKKDNGVPTIEFGTEILTSADNSLAGLLGASPGGSVCVKVMIDVIKKCFSDKVFYPEWEVKINKIIFSDKKN